MKKKIILCSLVLGMAFVLGACGSNETPSGTASSEVESVATDDSDEDETTDDLETDDSTDEADEEAYTIEIPEDPDLDVWNISKEELPQLNDPQPGDYIATIKTNMGDIKLALFPKYAPKTVENFVTHAQNGFYDGVIFHRVVEDFMIQGGDPEGTGMGGESIWGDDFDDEISPYLYNIRGAISMANKGLNADGSGTNGSQFFIVLAGKSDLTNELMTLLKADNKDQNAWIFLLAPREYGGFGFGGYGFPDIIMDYYLEQGGTPHLDTHHTVFGQIIEGIEIAEAIAGTEVIANPSDTTEEPEVSYPKEQVIISTVEIEEVE